MALVTMFKMPFETKHFNKNQKVFVQLRTGQQSVKVIGKFRGKGRYVSAWVSWRKAEQEAPEFKEIEVEDGFAEQHQI